VVSPTALGRFTVGGDQLGMKQALLLRKFASAQAGCSGPKLMVPIFRVLKKPMQNSILQGAIDSSVLVRWR
jgi:hypothetical protein